MRSDLLRGVKERLSTGILGRTADHEQRIAAVERQNSASPATVERQIVSTAMTSTAAPVAYATVAEIADIASAEAAGTSSLVARGDHVHAHPVIASGDLHSEYVKEADANYVDLTDGGATTLHSHAGGSAHTIRENGVDQTARTGLNFVDTDAGAGLITDDAGGNETEVNLNLYVLKSMLTTRGDVYVRDASAVVRKALGASGTVFRSDGTDPQWATLYSRMKYVNVPDAAVGVAITAGDAQGAILHSGPSAETADALEVDAETAPGASGLPVTWQYGDTNDLDTVASWTTIATYTLSSEKSNRTTSMTNATIPANRLIRTNWGTIVGTPKDATTTLHVKSPLVT